MLAYTVWHHPQNEVSPKSYQDSLIHFHETMSELKPASYLSSAILSMPGVPWMEPDSAIYMDWYFIENAAALEPLNQSVLHGRRKTDHDTVAQCTSGGVTALYQPKMGVNPIRLPKQISWLSKPKGMTYTAFFDELTVINSDDHASLWMRYLALGPGPEFCVVSATEFQWDERFQPLVRYAEKIWDYK